MSLYQVIQESGISLHANESPYPIEDSIKAELKAALSTIPFHRYPDDRALQLREAYAAYLRVDPACIMAGNGSDELIGLLISVCITKGKRILTLDPDFSMYDYYAKRNEGVLIKYPYDGENPFDIHDAIAFAQAQRIDMILLSNPNNPSGHWIPVCDIDILCRFFPQIPIVIDEAYGEFAPESSISLLAKYPQLFVLRTMSKAFGMAGLRCGFLLADKDTMSKLSPYKVPYNVNAFTQCAAVILLSHQEQMYRHVQAIIQERERLYHALREQFQGILTIHPSHANYLYGASRKKEEMIQVLTDHHITIRNYADSDHFRITIGTPEENNLLLSVLQKHFKQEEIISCER